MSPEALFSAMVQVLFVGVTIAVALAPWWFVGRYGIPARERLPLVELGWRGHLATFRRGTSWYTATLPAGHPARPATDGFDL